MASRQQILLPAGLFSIRSQGLWLFQGPVVTKGPVVALQADSSP